MILAGLPFATLAAIFAIAGFAVLALYILKLRRRTVAVPFSILWRRILKDKEATSLFSKLKRLLSLLMQLLLLALLIFALGDPRGTEALIKGRNFVVLVDASASMQANDVTPTRLDVAKDEVKSLIRSLNGADRMLIAQMDAAVTPLGPMSSETSDLERSVDAIKPTEARADFPRALRFATDTLRGVENGEIVVVSDGDLGPATDSTGPVRLGDVKISYMAIGKNKDNVGITQFSVRRYPLDKSRYEVMLEVTNTSDDVAEIELSLLGDGQLVDVTKLRLQPHEPLARFYPNLSGASRTLEAKLLAIGETKDALPADDHAYALLPERRRAKVLVVTLGNTYLEAALLLDEYLEVTMATPVEYANKYASGQVRFDSVIFDQVTPTNPPRMAAFYIDPRGPGSPVKVEEAIANPGFDKIDRKHPIVRYTALDQVNIARGHKLRPDPQDKVVGASFDGPILVAGTRGGFKFVAMSFDVRESDLPLRVAWPVLLLNTLDWFTNEDASYLSSFRTGDVWRIPVAGPGAQATLSLPGGSTEAVPVHEGRAVFLGQRAGFYDLAAMDVGDPPKDKTTDKPAIGTTTSFAANLLSSEESAIGPAPELPLVDGKEAGKVDRTPRWKPRDVWIYLLLAAVILTVVEWATYHRRVTV